MMLVIDSDVDSEPVDAPQVEEGPQSSLKILPRNEPPRASVSDAAAQDETSWPPEVDLILSALEVGQGSQVDDRRESAREPYRTRAALRLFSDPEGALPSILFTRDVDRRGMGFITRHRLPLGYGGMIRLTLPGGREIEAACTLLRCREAAPGWYEGALNFNRPQLFTT